MQLWQFNAWNCWWPGSIPESAPPYGNSLIHHYVRRRVHVVLLPHSGMRMAWLKISRNVHKPLANRNIYRHLFCELTSGQISLKLCILSSQGFHHWFWDPEIESIRLTVAKIFKDKWVHRTSAITVKDCSRAVECPTPTQGNIFSLDLRWSQRWQNLDQNWLELANWLHSRVGISVSANIDQYRQNRYIGISSSTSANISADINIGKSFHIG